jgi:hypothetical protein
LQRSENFTSTATVHFTDVNDFEKISGSGNVCDRPRV